ncbi:MULTISPECIES: STAS domain-containing protein [unclassified Streptomyces]|uniref:STAS domain-containing protein n=1 Tax=unclassified Streptomyces TaxID=2593676 RepID=UPI00093D79C2|nr:STAS domain-containing protein [Streptomyces sp. CB02058]OKI87484.1 anti-anti-sigma factor [Streptomyces sp. CB02058]
MVRDPLDNSTPAASPVVAAEGEINGCWVVRARGEIDCDSIDPLFIAMWQAVAGHEVVVLDTSAITFADSSFLSLLIETHQQTRLRVAAPSAAVTRLLRTAGVDRVIKTYPTLDAALASPPPSRSA